MPYNIFISHSSRDTWVAGQIAKYLRGLGAAVFLDNEAIAFGDNFEEVIEREIGEANELLVLLTPWAIESPYVWMEIGMARMRNIRTSVVLLGITPAELQATEKIPPRIKCLHLLDINELPRYFAQLEDRLSGFKNDE